MKKTTILCVMALLCLSFWAKGQEVKPLMVGDKLPKSFWQGKHAIYQNGKITSQVLAQYSGKLLMLDFWASWCAPCVAKIPKIYELNERFASNFNCILVSNENERVASASLASIGVNSATIVKDKLLAKYFPHLIIPHYVWIKDEHVIAITGSDEVTENNISRYILGDAVKVVAKIDWDKDKPIFIRPDIELEKMSYFSVLSRGRLTGVGSSTLISNNAVYKRVLITNSSLYAIYEWCFRGLDQSFELDRFKINLKDSGGFEFKGKAEERKRWGDTSVYSFELMLDAKDKRNICQVMLSELNSATGISATIVPILEKCFSLEVVDSNLLNKGPIPIKDPSFPDQIMVNGSLARLVSTLNNKLKLGRTIVDQTSLVRMLNIALPAKGKVMEINRILAGYGLRLKPKRLHVNYYQVINQPNVLANEN